jgi:regulator of protease activity HflC (stomatin/prohibitin superfamily)
LKLLYGLKKEEKKMASDIASTKDRVMAAIIGWLLIIIIPIIFEFFVGIFLGTKWTYGARVLSSLVVIVFVVTLLWVPKRVWFTKIDPETTIPFGLMGKYLGFMPNSDTLRYKNDDKTMTEPMVPINDVEAGRPRRFLGHGVVTKITGGLVFFLWPLADTNVRKFRFVRVKISKKGMEKDFTEKIIDYVFLKLTSYNLLIIDLDDIGMAVFGIDMELFLKTTDPFKAVISTHDSLVVAYKIIEAMIRRIAKEKSIDDWKSSQGKDEIEARINAELLATSSSNPGGGTIKDEILKKSGYLIDSIKITNIIPPEAKRRATEDKSAAKDRAEIKVIEARANAEATKIGADADTYRYEKVYKIIKDFGNDGLLIRAFEAMEKNPMSASIVTANVPALNQLLSALKISPSELSPEAIKQIKDMIENKGGQNNP